MNATTPCLLVSKAYLLQVYVLENDRLRLFFQKSLHGVIMSMKAVLLPHNRGKASLILAFKDAKVSIVEYQPSLHDLITISIHFFEREEFKVGGCQLMIEHSRSC